MSLISYPFINSILRAISLILSVIFVLYAARGLVAYHNPIVLIFSIITCGYGLFNLLLLIATHPKLIKQSKILLLIRSSILLNISYPILWIIGSFDVGMISAQEIISFFVVATLSFMIWLGVTRNIQTFKKQIRIP